MYMYMKLIQNLGALLFFILVILNKIVQSGKQVYEEKKDFKILQTSFY